MVKIIVVTYLNTFTTIIYLYLFFCLTVSGFINLPFLFTFLLHIIMFKYLLPIEDVYSFFCFNIFLFFTLCCLKWMNGWLVGWFLYNYFLLVANYNFLWLLKNIKIINFLHKEINKFRKKRNTKFNFFKLPKIKWKNIKL